MIERYIELWMNGWMDKTIAR